MFKFVSILHKSLSSRLNLTVFIFLNLVYLKMFSWCEWGMRRHYWLNTTLNFGQSCASNMNFDHSPALRMVNSTCLQQHLIKFTFCHNDWSLLFALYWLLFSTSILPSSYWRISIRCFCLRFLKYCTTTDAVHWEERTL